MPASRRVAAREAAPSMSRISTLPTPRFDDTFIDPTVSPDPEHSRWRKEMEYDPEGGSARVASLLPDARDVAAALDRVRPRDPAISRAIRHVSSSPSCVARLRT